MAQLVKHPPAVQETPVRFLSQGRSGEGKGYPLQYSGLESSMDCIGHGVGVTFTFTLIIQSILDMWSTFMAAILEVTESKGALFEGGTNARS